MLTDAPPDQSQTNHVHRHHRSSFGKEMTGFRRRLRLVVKAFFINKGSKLKGKVNRIHHQIRPTLLFPSKLVPSLCPL